MQLNCAQSLYLDADATLDDLREAVTTLEDTERTARRVGASTRQQTGLSNRCDEREQSSPRANSTLICLRKTVYENL